MSTDKQLAFAASLADQILAVWCKLGGKYASWAESNIHAALHKRGRSFELHASWDEYDTVELQRSIGMLQRMLAEYRKRWNAQWQADRDARQQQMFERDRVREECKTWDEALEWMQRHAPGRKAVEYFTYETKILQTTYWRKRDKPVTLYSEREARDLHSVAFPDAPFDSVFEPTGEPGWDGTLYVPLFSFATREADR
jgi:hypothetical protein